MKVLFLSPGYPAEMPYFVRGLAAVGAQVLGLGPGQICDIDVGGAGIPAGRPGGPRPAGNFFSVKCGVGFAAKAKTQSAAASSPG